MRAARADETRPGLRERKKQLTRQAILDTAQAMFRERGYDGVTVAEIADAVNIAAKTVFVYFPSKEDLVFDGEAEMRGRIAAPHHPSIARRPIVDEIAGGGDRKTQALRFAEIGEHAHRLSLSTTEHAGKYPTTRDDHPGTLSFLGAT